MSDNSGVDKGLLALIQGVLGTRHSTPPPQFELPREDPVPAQTMGEPQETAPDTAVAQEAVLKGSEGIRSVADDRRKSAAELAGIILRALQTLDGAPATGFEVTVYGGNPWNAMLTIKPQAGPIADPGLWRARVREMAVRLRQDYDVTEN